MLKKNNFTQKSAKNGNSLKMLLKKAAQKSKFTQKLLRKQLKMGGGITNNQFCNIFIYIF